MFSSNKTIIMIQIRKDFFAKFHLRSAVILALFLIIFFGLASITNIFPKAASVIFPEDFSTVVYKLQTTDGGLWVGGGVFTADTTPSVQTSFKNPTPGYGFWDDVDFVDDQIGWLLDSRTIMKTTDGGVDWIQQQTAIASVTSFVKLSVVSGAVAYIATIDEKIIKTTNGGTTWGNVIFDDTDFEDDAYQFSAIDCIDADTCFVSGGSEDDTAFFLISTTDGFDTFSVDWDPGVDDCKITDVIDIDFTDATTGWFIGDDEICKTEDGGLNFTAEVTGAATTFADLEMFDDLTGWAVGSGGKVYATQDGDTWATQTCSGCGDLASIDSASATHVWISDETNDRMIISTVGGEGDNWQNTQSLPITFDGPLALDVVSTTNAFVIGSLNNDLTKTINGIAWTDATFNPTVGASVDDIDFSTLGTNGWAVSGNSIVYSTDSGETWDDGDVSALPGILFNSVDFVDDNDGWAVGNGSTIAYSSNAGLGWAAQVTDGGAPGTFSSVSVDPSCASPASPPACVVIAGGTGNVYYTADGGATNWHNSDVVVNINAVQMLDSLNGIAVSDSGKIFRTENAGVNFVEVYDAGAVSLKGIGFAFPTTVGIVVGSSGTILRTEDAGATWAPVANPSGGETFEEVSFYNASDGFIVSSTTGGAPIGGEVLITSNGGATWTESDESYVAFNSVKALDAATIWITGANGVISKSYIAPVTETAGFAYSTTVDDTAEDIVEVTLTADDSASPINTGFRYAVSNNGGNDFYEVEPCEIEPCEPFRFPGYGSDLRFQVIAFSGSLTDVPVLNDLTLDYTTNAAPDVPTFSAPADSATGVSTTGTVFTFSATDADSNDIYYVLDIATDAAFTNVRHHFDQRQNGTGWSQDGPYNSGSPATFTLPDSAQLAGSTTYYARVIAIDTFESSATSTAISFSTTESEPVTDPFDSYSLFNLDTLTAQLTASAARFSDAMFDDAGAVTMQFLRSFAAGAATVEPKEISAQITMDILDLDRDGILDFFHAGTGSTNVNFLENYFWPSGCGGCLNVNVTAQGNVNDLDHGNFNNDSYIDLVIASSAGIKIVSFGDAADTELAIGATTDVEVADIDRDGKDEIIVSGDELLMEPIVEFVGEGTYQTSAPTDLDTSNLISVAADFDLDGDMDIAHGQTSAANDPGNHLYIREADGTYTKTVNAFGAEDTDDFKIADLDLDGDMDVVLVYNDAFGNIDLYINNGSAEFTTDPLNSWIFGQQINKIVLADADLDGDPDLFVAGDVSLEMLTNEGDGTFMDLFPSVVGGDIIGLMVNDVDGNGGADIVYATAAAANILRDDVAYATQDTAIADFGDNIATGDIDGDGDIDAISNTNAEVNQHINNGDGTFTTTEILADGTPTVATAVALYDVDADSDLDAIFGTDTPVLAFNPGTGFDGAYTDTSLGASTYARYVFGDLDIDGDADILLQKAAGGIDWFRNDGGETFTDQGVLGVAPQFAIMLDFDLDGDADSWKLTSDIHPSQKGTWTEQNDGGLVFSNDSQLFNKTVGERDHTLGVTADFDNDGDVDINDYNTFKQNWGKSCQ
ncbi:TPA: hypothetical protein DCZ32_03620 [Candidatus Uhrbacteria bacterium]|nr:hypothetical protein [Candidatus Uhrbacteria bacterium]